ncbi:uncharacterized protein isoform X3 [Leptinotarsa decemlineata]
MLAVMEASQSDAGPSNSANNIPVTPESPTNAQEFLSSGRTGRRNALPDILDTTLQKGGTGYWPHQCGAAKCKNGQHLFTENRKQHIRTKSTTGANRTFVVPVRRPRILRLHQT